MGKVVILEDNELGHGNDYKSRRALRYESPILRLSRDASRAFFCFDLQTSSSLVDSEQVFKKKLQSCFNATPS